MSRIDETTDWFTEYGQIVILCLLALFILVIGLLRDLLRGAGL
jgi:hypothetical protein